MDDRTANMGKLAAHANELRGPGATALFVAADGKPRGIIAVADPINPATQAALDTLGSAGKVAIQTASGTLINDDLAGIVQARGTLPDDQA